MNQKIELLKQRDPVTISEIYVDYREGFILFARRYKISSAQILDIYQDAIIALCENADKGNLDALKGSLKTYLFSIGKYMIFRELKTQNQQIEYRDYHLESFVWEDYSEEEYDKNILKLRESYSRLGKKCQEILKLFYYQEKSLDEITHLMSYDNKDVVKSQKSRCLSQLKKIIKAKNG